MSQTSTASMALSGDAAGVPYFAVPPRKGPSESAPVVFAWHPLDPPRTEIAFAAALPLAGLDAWRIYLGLPLSGSRLPSGGWDELMRLGFDDAVMKLQQPIIEGAAEEFGPAYAALRERFPLAGDAVALMGASMGAAVAQLVLAESDLAVRAAVLVSPLVQLRRAVDAMARRFEFTYPWSEDANRVAARLDFVARASQIAERQHEPAILLVAGEQDDEGIREPAAQLQIALADRYVAKERAQIVTIPGMGHALAQEPGIEPTPQTAQARTVDELAVRWLQRYLRDRE